MIKQSKEYYSNSQYTLEERKRALNALQETFPEIDFKKSRIVELIFEKELKYDIFLVEKPFHSIYSILNDNVFVFVAEDIDGINLFGMCSFKKFEKIYRELETETDPDVMPIAIFKNGKPYDPKGILKNGK